MKAFTTEYNGLSNVLDNQVTIVYEGRTLSAKARWDTGATSTFISKQVASNLTMIATGKANYQSASGTDVANTYLVDILLPNGAVIKEITVTDSNIGDQGIDVLVGMDIITLGDFIVSNYNSKTVFSFRTPSQRKFDFVQDIQMRKAMGQPHGKGKRKHK